MDVMILGFHYDDTVSQLQTLNPHWNIVWIGCEKQRIVNSLCKYSYENLQYGHIGDQPFSGAYAEHYQKVYANFPFYHRMMSRVSGEGWVDWTLQEYINLFNLHFDFFAFLFQKYQPKLVLFSNLPHEGFDAMPYLLAKTTGIPTIMLSQSMFPNRFMYDTNVETYGDFAEKPLFEPPKPYIIQNTTFTRPFYTPSKPKPPYDFMSILNNILSLLREKGLARLLMRYYRLNNYEYDLRTSYSKDTVNFYCPFVYFPLHMQPELTTCTIGKNYDDQLLAIERLSTFIPKDWIIYVKNHVVQTEQYRGSLFFKRMSRIANVRFIHPATDTFKLISHSQFVSTITGTVGWEAVTHGKKTLIFGYAWYRTLPGVFEYDKGVTFEMIMAYKINHTEVEQKTGEIIAKMLPGIIAPDYAILKSDFNCTENAKCVAQSITCCVNHILSKT